MHIQSRTYVFLWVLALALGACSPADQLHFASRGVGTDVPSYDIAEQTRLQSMYFGYLCKTANIPYDSWTDGVLHQPYCSYDAFSVADWNTLVQAGLNDIDRRCDAYLGWLDNRKRSEAPILKQISDTATRTQAILGVTGASVIAIDVVAQAFGYVGDTVTNYYSRLLFEVDATAVQTLVLNHQRELRIGLAHINFNNKPAVEHALRSYLRICLPFTIETEINSSIVVYQRTRDSPQPLISAGTSYASVMAGQRALSSRTLVSERPQRKELPPYKSSARVRELFVGSGFTDKDADAVQRSLCVSPGPVGSETKSAIAIFEAYKGGDSRFKVDGKITNRLEYALATAAGPCDREKFRNIFEFEKLKKPNRVEAFIGRLNEVGSGEHVDQKLSLNDPKIRSKIVAANSQFHIKLHHGSARDQVTPDLYKHLGIR